MKEEGPLQRLQAGAKSLVKDSLVAMGRTEILILNPNMLAQGKMSLHLWCSTMPTVWTVIICLINFSLVEARRRS